MTRNVAFAAGFAVMFVLAGCGSSGTMSKSEYIQRSDAICAKVAKADNAIPDTTPLPDVIAAEGRTVEDAIDDLRALDRPPGMDAELDAWFAALDAEADWFDRAMNDPSSVDTMLHEAAKLDARVRHAAARVGFHACAN